MNIQSRDFTFYLALILVLLACISRLIPHPPNFTPISAIAIFSGAMIADKKLAFLIPFTIVFFTDLIIGMHNYIWAVYLSFAINTFLGILISKNLKFLSIFIVGVFGSLQFYIITNFAVWLNSGIYNYSLEGLLECYTLAIPFYQNSILGDIFYITMLFLIYITIKNKLVITQNETS